MRSSTEINIGIVGSHDSLNLVKDVLRDFPNICPHFLEMNSQDYRFKCISEIENRIETLLFTDYYTCQLYRTTQEQPISSRYIPVTTSGLYEVLFKMRDRLSMANLSIDTISRHHSMSIIDNLKSFHVNFLSAPKDMVQIEDILNFHIANYTKNSAIILTAIDSVYAQLKDRNIPCELIPLTHLDVVNALERSLLATQTRFNNESQTIIGIIRPENIDDAHRNPRLQRIITNYIDSIDGYTIQSTNNEYVFVSTRGVFERESRGYKFLPLLHESKSLTGVGLSIGIGFGHTALSAGKHARLALTQSQEAGGDVCYIVREDQSVFGPVASTSSHGYEKYQITITNPKLLQQAETLGMSASYMNKIMSRVARYNQIEYTANDLSEILDVTLRSANRILLKWNDAGLVSIIGEEKPTRHGRPRRVYRLNFVSNPTEHNE